MHLRVRSTVLLSPAWHRSNIERLGGIEVDPLEEESDRTQAPRDLSHVADLVPETPKLSLTRRERLERWIEVLGREPGRALNTLREIEHKPRDARHASRVDNSPLRGLRRSSASRQRAR